MSQQLSDVEMGEGDAQLTDEQLAQLEKDTSNLSADPANDRLKDALAINAVQQQPAANIQPAQPAAIFQPAQPADDETGVNDSSAGDSSSEEDTEYDKFRAAIANRIENAKKAGYILKEPAAIFILENEEALDEAGYDFKSFVKEGSTKIFESVIVKAVSDIEMAKADAELTKKAGIIAGSQEFNCDTQEDDDDDYVDGTNKTSLNEMSYKELTDFIATKSASKDVLKEEMKAGPINIIFKESLDAAEEEEAEEEQRQRQRERRQRERRQRERIQRERRLVLHGTSINEGIVWGVYRR
jgi:hypothetical protein